VGRKYTLANGAALYAQNGSTEFKVIGSTGDVIAGELYVGNSTAIKAMGSTGLAYSNTVPVNYFEDGTTTANLKAYGLSFVQFSTAATTIKKYTLDAPIKGTFKELVLASSAAIAGSSDVTVVVTGSSDIDIVSFGTTAIATDLHTVAMAQPYSYARLVGVSTARWAILDFESGSTNVAYKAAAGLSSSLSTGIVST